MLSYLADQELKPFLVALVTGEERRIYPQIMGTHMEKKVRNQMDIGITAVHRD